MNRSSLYVIFGLFSILSLSCFKENFDGSIRGNNQLLLRKIKMDEYRGGNKEVELLAEYLSYDKDRSEILIADGSILTDIVTSSVKDKVDISFEKGVYNFRSKRLDINIKGGLLIDKGIRVTAGNLEIKTDEGYIKGLNKVQIRGGNFEFEGGGFFGNIKDGTFVFEEGVKGRIF